MRLKSCERIYMSAKSGLEKAVEMTQAATDFLAKWQSHRFWSLSLLPHLAHTDFKETSGEDGGQSSSAAPLSAASCSRPLPKATSLEKQGRVLNDGEISNRERWRQARAGRERANKKKGGVNRAFFQAKYGRR